jgi:uncharacterized protein YigA (DUF484 family)|tara:strand:+ start:2071 stop:2700 length:630 start_codon:yes stop_codon:yes gene_type:complete
MTKEISAKEVELYLLKNTDFFLTRESIVSELDFKHSPGKAESLLERQVRKLRNEQKNLLDSLSVFLSNASENEDLFIKSKALILKIVTAADEEALIELMPKNLKKIFDVDVAYLQFFTNSEMNDLEESTGMTFSVGETKHGSFANKKIQILFEDDSIKSVVISVFKNKNKIGLLLIGSKDKTRYLGDEDTTFIEFIRDITEAKLKTFPA